MLPISNLIHASPSIVSVIKRRTWVYPILRYTRDPPPLDVNLRHYALERPNGGWSIPGVRPSTLMLTTPVLQIPISFALPRDGRGTQGWAVLVSPVSMIASPSIVSVNMRADLLGFGMNPKNSFLDFGI
jgi:hypothetical protein